MLQNYGHCLYELHITDQQVYNKYPVFMRARIEIGDSEESMTKALKVLQAIYTVIDKVIRVKLTESARQKCEKNRKRTPTAKTKEDDEKKEQDLDECRGKIVAVLRGPRAPAPACNYSVKLFYCQDAGAVGVIFVDWDPTGRFTIMPRVENGPIFPGGPSLTVGIPAMFTLYAYSGALQEGALHTMMVAPPNCVGVPEGWRIGFLFCRRQESRRGMSKEKADQLLNDFFSSRRAERLEEQDLLQDQLDHLRHGVDDLDKKELTLQTARPASSQPLMWSW